MAQVPLHLNAGCPGGQSQPFFEMKPDGTSAPFSLPAGMKFNMTDISIVPAQLSSPQAVLAMIGLRQTIPGGHCQQWNFAGYITQNVERSFATPVVFSTDFEAWNPGMPMLNVNVYGYLSR